MPVLWVVPTYVGRLITPDPKTHGRRPPGAQLTGDRLGQELPLKRAPPRAEDAPSKCRYLQREVERNLRPAMLRRRHVIDEIPISRRLCGKAARKGEPAHDASKTRSRSTLHQRNPKPSSATSKTPQTAL